MMLDMGVTGGGEGNGSMGSILVVPEVLFV